MSASIGRGRSRAPATIRARVYLRSPEAAPLFAPVGVFLKRLFERLKSSLTNKGLIQLFDQTLVGKRFDKVLHAAPPTRASPRRRSLARFNG